MVRSESGQTTRAARGTKRVVNVAPPGETLDPAACYDALVSRDRRFDGRFFVGVATTGIYCRPVCPARTPGRDRCTFFEHASGAEQAGFRACFRCRPELAPGTSQVDARSRLTNAATTRIDAGALDEGSVADLARELGVTERHLRRTMTKELGVSPIAWAETRRLALAKELLQDTTLPITQIAYCAGFKSVRRFNDVVRERLGRTPSGLRKNTRAKTASSPGEDRLRLRLGLRPPFDWHRMLHFLEAHAIPRVERVVRDRTHEQTSFYARTVTSRGHTGQLVVRRIGETALSIDLPLSLATECLPIAAKVRALFDLDADPAAIRDHLQRDPALAKALAHRPGLRVPGSFDRFEIAVRTVLGQQVSVAGATTLSGRLVARFGEPIAASTEIIAGTEGLDHLFPTAKRLANASIADLRAIGLTEARASTVQVIAQAFEDGLFDAYAGFDPVRLRAALLELRGVGPWTADALLMRVTHWPDAFPAGDLVLRNQLQLAKERDVEARAAPWRPWRAYAAMHIWAEFMDGKQQQQASKPTKPAKKGAAR